MFRFLALLLHDAGSKTNRAKLLPLFAVVCLLWCGSVCAQDAPAGLRLGSHAPSIQVIFGGLDQNSGMYRVLLKNLSSHVATDVSAGGFPVKGQGQGRAVDGPIKPGGTITLSMPPSEQNGLLVDAALFDDGSYEGSLKWASFMAATKVGRWTEWEQIKPCVDEIIAMDASDESKLEMIREAVPKLPEDFKLAMERLKKTYPALPMTDPFALDSLRSALHTAKVSLIATLDDQKFLDKSPSQTETLAQWWASNVKNASRTDPYNSPNK
ncbi:MAG: hypothetical protein ABSD64_13135 [Terriglobales bacterium]|jgi:hypothetical protein